MLDVPYAPRFSSSDWLRPDTPFWNDFGTEDDSELEVYTLLIANGVEVITMTSFFLVL
jgi:hypothetical protein